MGNEIHCFKENWPREKGKGILTSHLRVLTQKGENPFTTNLEVIDQDDINEAATDFYKYIQAIKMMKLWIF